MTSNIVGTNVATVGGTGATGAGFSAPTTSAAGSSLVLTDAGGAHSTLYYVNSADTSNSEATTNGTFSNLTELVDAINGASNTTSEITASSVNGGTQLQLANHTGTTGSITVGGDVGSSLGFNTTAYDNNYNSSLATAVNANQTLTIQVGSDTAHTLTFGTGTGQISTLAGLNTALSALGDVTATVNGSGKLVLDPDFDQHHHGQRLGQCHHRAGHLDHAGRHRGDAELDARDAADQLQQPADPDQPAGQRRVL